MDEALTERVEAYRAVRLQRALLERQMRALQFELCAKGRQERALARAVMQSEAMVDVEVRQVQAEADAELERRPGRGRLRHA